MEDNNQTKENQTKETTTPDNTQKQNTSESSKKPSTISEIVSGIVGAVAGAAAGDISFGNPFSKSNADALPPKNSSISGLNSNPSGGDSGTVGESDFGGNDTQQKSTIEVLSKIYKTLVETNSTVNTIARDTSTLAKSKTQQDVSSDLLSTNQKARQNENWSKVIPANYASYRNATGQKEEESSILDDVMNFFTKGKKKKIASTAKNIAKEANKKTAKKVEKEIAKEVEKDAPSAADQIAKKIEKRGLLESTKGALKDAFSGWGSKAEKEAAKDTAKKVEENSKKGILDKLKDAFTKPKAKNIAKGAAIGGAAASIPGDTSDQYLKTMGMIESEGKPKAHAPEGGAAGLFQFIPSTWRSVMLLMHPGMKESEINYDDRYDPKKAEEAARFLTEYNRKQFIKKYKREPTDKELYLMHFGGADTKLLSADPNELGVDVYNKGSKNDKIAIKNNKDIFYKGHKRATKNRPEVLGTPRTIQEIKDLFGNKYDEKLRRVEKGDVSQEIKNIGSDKKTERIPEKTTDATPTSSPEINGKKLTGDTTRNPYFGKESTPYTVPFEETGQEPASAFKPVAYNPEDTESASTFKPAVYNPDTEPANAFSGSQFARNKPKQEVPQKTTKTDPLSYTVDTPGENSVVQTSKKSGSKSPNKTNLQTETTTVTTTGGGSHLRVQEQSEEEKEKLAKEDADQKERERAGSDASYDPVKNSHSKYKLTGKRILDHEPNKQEKEIIDIDQKRAMLMNERTNIQSSGVNVDKETMDKQLERLSGINSEMKELDEKRNNITGSKEYLQSIEKSSQGKQPQQQAQSQPTQSPPQPPPERGTVGNDDPTIKLMEEGLIA